MKISSAVLVLLTSSCLVAPVGAAGWGRDSLWNDNRAEVAIYDAERVVDGKTRKYQNQLIVTREDLREDTLVKANDPKKQKVMRAFKLNQVDKFDTDNYPQNYLTSVFVAADDLRHVLKITVGAQEWVGNVFKVYRDGNLTWYSYKDGEADQSARLELGENDYFEDQLVLALRGLAFKNDVSMKIRVWNSLATNEGVVPAVEDVVLTISEGEKVRGRFGSLPTWKVVLQYPNGSDTYWFEKASPNILVKMETRDGRKRLLYGRARWSYWDKRLPKPNVLK